METEFFENITTLIDSTGLNDAQFVKSFNAFPPTDIVIQKSRISDFNNFKKKKNGNGIPRSPLLSKLADYFDVSVDYLLGRTKDKTRDITAQAASLYTGISADILERYRNSPVFGNWYSWLIGYLLKNLCDGADCAVDETFSDDNDEREDAAFAFGNSVLCSILSYMMRSYWGESKLYHLVASSVFDGDPTTKLAEDDFYGLSLDDLAIDGIGNIITVDQNTLDEIYLNDVKKELQNCQEECLCFIKDNLASMMTQGITEALKRRETTHDQENIL